MDLNKSRTDTEPEGYQRADRVTIAKDMKVGDTLQLRILAGVEYREYLWWPTYAIDKNTKENKATWRSASLKKGNTNPIDEMAQLDLKMKEFLLASAGRSKDDANSSFSRTRKFLYAAIVRTSQGDKIKVVDAPWTVVEAISNLRKQTLSNGMLVNGLPYMYDIIITKTMNSATGKNSYSATPFNCTVQGKIEAKYLDESRCPYPNKRQFFTAEENEMIDACPWELGTYDPPIDNEELKTKLSEFPIDLSRRRKDNPMAFMYFSTTKELEIITAKLSANGVGVLIPHAQDIAGAGLLPGPQAFQNILDGKPLPEPLPPPKAQALSAPPQTPRQPQEVHAEVTNVTASAPVPTPPAAQPVAPAMAPPPAAPIADPSRVAQAVAPVFTPPPGPAPAMAPVAPAPAPAVAPAPAAPAPGAAATLADGAVKNNPFKGKW